MDGRLVDGRLVDGRLVDGRLVLGRLVLGRLVDGRLVGRWLDLEGRRLPLERLDLVLLLAREDDVGR